MIQRRDVREGKNTKFLCNHSRSIYFFSFFARRKCYQRAIVSFNVYTYFILLWCTIRVTHYISFRLLKGKLCNDSEWTHIYIVYILGIKMIIQFFYERKSIHKNIMSFTKKTFYSRSFVLFLLVFHYNSPQILHMSHTHSDINRQFSKNLRKSQIFI